ncbi:MAG: hypothetical protein Q4F15_00090 [Bacillota bacterium]|nr:hypothetical protein [Bacillota bacterium]
MDKKLSLLIVGASAFCLFGCNGNGTQSITFEDFTNPDGVTIGHKEYENILVEASANRSNLLPIA